MNQPGTVPSGGETVGVFMILNDWQSFFLTKLIPIFQSLGSVMEVIGYGNCRICRAFYFAPGAGLFLQKKYRPLLYRIKTSKSPFA
jgi:hypothetical protein